MTDFSKYPKTPMYQIIDTIGIPHVYMIGAKHVAHASDHFGGMLTKEAIRSLEQKNGPSCCMKDCNLSVDDHKTGLIVEVKFEGELADAPELQDYLKTCLPQAEKDNITGFAFMQKKDEN